MVVSITLRTSAATCLADLCFPPTIDACFYRAIHSTKPISLFPSSIPLTTPNILSALLSTPTPIEGFYVVPYVLKLLAESEEGVNLLKGMKLVTYGGAACPDELGDKLVKEHGVRLVEHYGLTEV